MSGRKCPGGRMSVSRFFGGVFPAKNGRGICPSGESSADNVLDSLRSLWGSFKMRNCRSNACEMESV
jgi:hypothetical protein